MSNKKKNDVALKNNVAEIDVLEMEATQDNVEIDETVSKEVKPEVPAIDKHLLGYSLIVENGKALKLSPKTQNHVFYQIAAQDDDGSLHIRLSGNEGGGLHSKEWISVNAKDEMQRFKDEQPEQFEAYAMRDAEIALAYGLRMFKFATVELGLSKCPITLGAMGVSVFLKMLKESGVDKREVFGECEITTQHWNAKLGRPHTKKELVPTDSRELFEHLAIRCYMGGRNECFTCGPSDIGIFYDFDLAGAYTTGMVDIRPLDYDRAFMTTNIDAFCGHVCGFARVRFSFPDGTRFPCFAVHHDLYGLYFPLTGETYTTAPEIEVARNMGATIEILQGVVIPWQPDNEPLFLEFVQLIREKRTSYPKKSYEESMWKLLGNTLYGKVSQGLRTKTAFELASGLSKDIPRSAVTNPYFAAHTTGFIRAVIGELLASVPINRQVISVTTDGFLTDASMDELNLTGPLCARFNAHNELVINQHN